MKDKGKEKNGDRERDPDRQLLDRAGSPRPGEGLDREALRRYLTEARPELLTELLPESTTAGDGLGLEVLQFSQGYSNLTYLVRLSRGAETREMILRRPPFGSHVATAHDMEREHRVLSRLHPLWDKAPRPLAFCDDEDVLGAPFYLMERVRGVILRRDPPAGLDFTPDTAHQLSAALVDTLAELHLLDLQASGLGELGKPEGYVERQIEGWSRRYFGSQTDDIPELERVASWLAERLPEVVPGSTAAFVHNDFKYDNLVLAAEDPTRIRAVLDWEMSTVGDPLMDLGTTLAYWVEAEDPEPLQKFRFGPTHLPGSLTRRQLARRYADRVERELPELTFYYVFGLFKIAVIAQQIYYRWKKGLTRDERFAALIHAIRTLARGAEQVVDTGRL